MFNVEMLGNKVFCRVFYKLPHGERGIYWYFRFSNGYGAVVSKDYHSFDGYRWHYKLMLFTPQDESLYYPFNDLIHTNGYWLEEEDVKDALEQTSKIPGEFTKKEYPIMFDFDSPIRVFHRLPHGEEGLYAYFQFSNGYGALVVKDKRTSTPFNQLNKVILFTPHEMLIYPYDGLISDKYFRASGFGSWVYDPYVKEILEEIRKLPPAVS